MLIGLSVAVLIAAWILQLSNQKLISNFWSSILYPAFYAVSGWRCFQTSRGSTANEKKAWICFASACFSLCWAELVWGYYVVYEEITIPTPSVADIGYLLFPVLMIGGIWFYSLLHNGKTLSQTQTGDFGITFSVVFLAHVLLFQSQIMITSSLVAIIIQILYGIGIVTALCISFIAIGLHVTGKKRRILILITLFLAGIVAMNFIYSYALINFEYTTDLPINTIYFISITLFYFAAYEEDNLLIDEVTEEKQRLSFEWAKQFETLIPAVAITLLIIEALMFSDALNEYSIPYLYLGGAMFVASLGYRSWWGHRINVLLHDEALRSKDNLQKLNHDLLNNKKRLQLALEANESGTWDWNLKTDKIHFDSNWHKLIGYLPEETNINLNNWEQLIHPDDLPEHNKIYDLYVNNQIATNETEYRIKHKDGHYIWINDRGKFVEWDKNGEPLRMIGVDTNITSRKMQEEIVLQSQKVDALGKLTGGVAHDFNNLLGIILGYSQLLKTSGDYTPNQINYIEQIYKASERGANLTKKLLSFTSRQAYEAKKINLKSLILQQQDMLQKTLTVRIKLVFDFAEEVWPVFLSESELEDAILNMSINAMHAMADEDSEARLTISISNQKLSKVDAQPLGLKAGNYVLLSLSDTGCGMDQATKERAFDPFYSTKGNKGTGLGLSQVFGFVERSNGAVKIISQPEHGSQFLIYLPRFYDNRDEVLQDRANKDAVCGGTETILLVDDEAALLDLLAYMLSQQGYHILTASSGRRALQILEKEQVDLIMTDIIMPEMDGYELSKIVQNNYSEVKIQLLSGFADAQKPDKIDEKLAQNIIYKPFKAEVMLHKIRDLLDT